MSPLLLHLRLDGFALLARSYSGGFGWIGTGFLTAA